MREESKENVKKLFMVLSGQHPLSEVTAMLPVIDTDNDLNTCAISITSWKECTAWADWWTRDTHLSMFWFSIKYMYKDRA